MKALSLLMVAALLGGCTGKKYNTELFKEFENKEVVEIFLSNYKLDTVPAEIGLLRNATTLLICIDSTHGWTVYPPLSAVLNPAKEASLEKLPDEITELKNLKNLTLLGLGLKSLPEDFDKLENLEMLDLTMNKLTFAKEFPKLKNLKKLRNLVLYFNDTDTMAVKNLSIERPDLQIFYQYDVEGAAF